MSRRLVVLLALLGAVVGGLVAAGVTDPGPGDPGGQPAEPRTARPDRTGPRTGAPLSTPVGRYVALGDSFTAGPLIPYVDARRTACLRSSANYPAVLASWLGADLVDASCSGADTSDLAGRQLAAVTPATDLVTVGTGGNDFGVFGSLVRRCPDLAATDPAGAPCREAFTRPDGTDDLLARVRRVETRLVTALRTVAGRAPDAVVAVIGYPRIVPASGTCAALPFAAGDYRWADRVERALNTSLAAAAARAGAHYVDTYGPSRGHDACSPAAWVNGGATSPTRALAFHPYAAGMRATAAAALRSLVGRGPTPEMQQRAEQLTTRRPPGTLTLRDQRVLAALFG